MLSMFMEKEENSLKSTGPHFIAALFGDRVRLGGRIIELSQQPQKIPAAEDRPFTPEFYLNRRVHAVIPP